LTKDGVKVIKIVNLSYQYLKSPITQLFFTITHGKLNTFLLTETF
jgi:hypothetical protein